TVSTTRAHANTPITQWPETLMGRGFALEGIRAMTYLLLAWPTAMAWLLLNGLLCACSPVGLGDDSGSPDTESRKDTAENFKTTKSQQSDSWLYKIAMLAQQGAVDEMVEQAVNHWDTSRNDAAWQIFGELACKLIDWEKRLHNKAKLDIFLVDGR